MPYKFMLVDNYWCFKTYYRLSDVRFGAPWQYNRGDEVDSVEMRLICML